MSIIRDNIQPPYWVLGEHDDLPAYDFCREIVESGTNEEFLDGAVGLYVDEDFWAVAALPYEYETWTCEALVKDLWPYEFRASFHPDHGTKDQEIEFLQREVRKVERTRDFLEHKVRELQRELRHSKPLPRQELSESKE